MASSLEKIWKATRELKPIIAAHRQEADRLRRLPPAVAQAFLERDIYRKLIPPDFGGAGLDPVTLFDLAEEVASFDGSAGWNFGIGAGAAAVVLGGLSAECLGQIFASPDCCFAASASPPGRALLVKDGFRVSGRFGFASGIDQARWLVAVCLIFDGDRPRLRESGGPAMICAVLPKTACTVLDTWHVGGMKGTGSTEFELADVFVPSEMAVAPFARHASLGDPVFRMPSTFFGLELAAVPLGIARSAVNGLKELAASKASLRDDTNAQYAAAKSEALINSARLYVHNTFGALWQKVVEDEPVGSEPRARARQAYVQAAEASKEAVRLCYEAVGSTAAMESHPFERALRDVHAASTHIVLRRTMMQEAGRVAFGLSPSNPLF